MKLAQNQVWKHSTGFIRIVQLERLAVRYKLSADLASLDGKHFSVTKKDFCRLLKDATLLSEEETRALRQQVAAIPESGDTAA